MYKIYSACVVAILIDTISIMPTVKDANTIWYYVGCFLAGAVCYFVTHFQDEKEPHRPSWKLRLSSSVAASYMGFYYYDSVKNLIIVVPFIDWQVKPFPTIHIFIGLCSYFGIGIFRELKKLSNFGFRKWVSMLGDHLKAMSKDKK